MTLDESKEEFLKELNKTNQLILGAYKNAVERLNKETQDLQEQNSELIEMLSLVCMDMEERGRAYSDAYTMSKELLTKYQKP